MTKDETIKVGSFGKAIAIILMSLITGLAGIGVNLGSSMYDKLEEINKTITQLHANIQFIDVNINKMDSDVSVLKERLRNTDLELQKVKAQCEQLWEVVKNRRRNRGSN